MSPAAIFAILLPIGISLSSREVRGSRADKEPWFRYRIDRLWIEDGNVMADLTAELRKNLVSAGDGYIRWKLKNKVIEAGASRQSYQKWIKTPYLLFEGCGGGARPL